MTSVLERTKVLLMQLAVLFGRERRERYQESDHTDVKGEKLRWKLAILLEGLGAFIYHRFCDRKARLLKLDMDYSEEE